DVIVLDARVAVLDPQAVRGIGADSVARDEHSALDTRPVAFVLGDRAATQRPALHRDAVALVQRHDAVLDEHVLARLDAVDVVSRGAGEHARVIVDSDAVAFVRLDDALAHDRAAAGADALAVVRLRLTVRDHGVWTREDAVI